MNQTEQYNLLNNRSKIIGKYRHSHFTDYQIAVLLEQLEEDKKNKVNPFIFKKR